ncbi:MAG: hypothetical protein AAF614_10795 [Chloroflexota bacterium]
MNSFWLEILSWFVICLAVAPLTLLLHELGHYLSARLSGAEALKLHWLSISFELESLSQRGKIAVAIAGPLISWLIILGCYLLIPSTKTSIWLPLILCSGLFANIRALVGLGPIIRTVLGHKGIVFTGLDEWEFARLLGLPPLSVIVASLLTMLAALLYFSQQALLLRGWAHLAILFIGYAISLFLYARIGPRLLPGGAGFA